MPLPLPRPRPQRPSSRAWLLTAAVAAVPLLAGVRSFAQVHARVGGEVVVAGGSDGPKKPPSQVTVHDSPDAKWKLDQAINMTAGRDWAKATEWYQSVLEQYKDRVVPSHEDAAGSVDQYRSIVFRVQEALAKWPAEGIAVYRGRYEATAAALLAAARPDDAKALENVFQTYFVTDAAKQAGMRLIDLHLENGDFAAAAEIGERLLAWHPGLVAERGKVLYRTALALHLTGEDKRAAERQAALVKGFPAATDVLLGREVTLADVLAKQLATPVGQAQAVAGDSANAKGTGPGNSTLLAGGSKPAARQFSIPIGSANRNNRTLPPDREGSYIGILPAVDRGELFFQTGQSLYGLSVDSGLPLPAWAQTYANQKNKCFTLAGAKSDRTQQTSVTVTDDCVLAVMGAASRVPINPYGGFQQPDVGGGTTIVCLDRRTGAKRWAVSPRNLKGEKGEAVAVEFGGSPAVVGDSVYVVARGTKDMASESCYLYCFDLAHGLDPSTQAPRWSCFLSSAPAAINYYGGEQTPPAAFSHMAYASGRLFVQTNLGSVASVDAYSGTVVWLSIYPRVGGGNGGPMRYPNQQHAAAKPWVSGPVMVNDGKVFVLPADGRGLLLVYDAGTGLEVKRIQLEDLSRPGAKESSTDVPTTLLAADADQVILGGDSNVWNVRWQDYQGGLPQEESQKKCVEWTTGTGGVPLRGRCFVIADAVFAPTSSRLLVVQMGPGAKRGGSVVPGGYPPMSREWDRASGEGPGNVVVTSDHVVLAGANFVDVFTDMDKARRKLDAEVAAAPGAAEPRLLYAEVMFASGDYALAMTKLREAIGLLGGPDTMRPGAGRDRVFNDALAFAQKLAARKDNEGNEQAPHFFDVAAAAAGGPSQQVSYRFTRAAFANGTSDLANAVRLYQQVLSDPALGSVPSATDDNASIVSSAVRAEKEIADIIAHHPEAYEPIEKAANEALEQALTASDPDKLQAVARTYPNSAKVYNRAMQVAAEQYEKAGKGRLATQVLRQVYLKTAAGEGREGAAVTGERARILEDLARNSLALPGHLEVAIAQMQKLSAVDPGQPSNPAQQKLQRPLKLPGGAEMPAGTPYQDVYSALLASAGDGGEAIPDFHFPYQITRDAKSRVVISSPFKTAGGTPAKPIVAQVKAEDVLALIQPPPELREMGRPDRVVAWTGGGLAVFASGADKPLAVKAGLFEEAPAGAAWVRADGAAAQAAPPQQLLAWNGKEVALLAGDDLRVLWRSPLKALSPIDVVTTPSTAEAAQPVATADADNDPDNIRVNNFAMRRGFNRMNARVMVNGVNAPAEEEKPIPVDEQVWQVRPAGDCVVVATTTGRVFGIRLSDGKVNWQTRLGHRPADKVLANGDFVVVRYADENGAQQLFVLDGYDGQIIHRRTKEEAAGVVNLALSGGGLLVWTMPNRICALDLYEPEGTKLKFEVGGDAASTPTVNGRNFNNGMPPQQTYAGLDKPDQLVLVRGGILALEQMGHRLAVRSIETGRLVKHPGAAEDKPSTLATGAALDVNNNNATEARAWLRVAGSYVYAISTRTMRAYGIADPAALHWEPYGGDNAPTVPHMTDALVGKDFLVLVDQPQARQNVAPLPPIATQVVLHAFSRRMVPEGTAGVMKESGNGTYSVTVANPAGILQWQAAQGGLYYLSGDHVLHFLPGARE